MTIYDKVKARYDYLINHTVYGLEAVLTPDPFDFSTRALYRFDFVLAIRAHYALVNHLGVCDDYTSAFVLMTRRIGLESYFVSGKIEGDGHAWALIKMNGQYYLFDPQVEDNIAKGGPIKYWLFFKSEHPDGFNYEYRNRDADISSFRGFETAPYEDSFFGKR